VDPATFFDELPSNGWTSPANNGAFGAGNFSIWLRAYWPDQAILDGTWKPPIIKIAN
jgi:hypothetical protein